MIDTIVCFVIENRLGEIVGFADTLNWAKSEATRLSAVTGQVYSIIEHRDTNGVTAHIRVS